MDGRIGVLTEQIGVELEMSRAGFCSRQQRRPGFENIEEKLQRESIFREIKLRKHYENPSERKVREKAEAVRRARNLPARNCSGRDFCHRPNLG